MIQKAQQELEVLLHILIFPSLLFVFLVLWNLLLHCLRRDYPSQGWHVLAMAKDLPGNRPFKCKLTNPEPIL